MKLLLILLSVLKVALVGDPQVDNETELAYARKSIYAELQSRTDLDLVIILGDLVNENPGLILPSEASLDSLRCPWKRVNGNHDGPEPEGDLSFEMKGIRFVLMNNVRKLRRGGYEGGLNETQKQWLDSLARHAPANEKFVLCTHIPLSESRGLDSLSNILSNRKDVLFVSGHTHNVDRKIIERGVEEVQAGAACGSWWRGVKDSQGVPYALMNCGAPRGYFIADFNTSSRKWYGLEYKCVNRPSEDRCSVSRRDGKIIVNVYGGSREGNVDIKVGGRWMHAAHHYAVASETWEIIYANQSQSREFRKAHRDEFIPLRRIPSPHLWAVEAVDPAAVTAVRYRDPAWSFKQKFPSGMSSVRTGNK